MTQTVGSPHGRAVAVSRQAVSDSVPGPRARDARPRHRDEEEVTC